VTLPKSRQHPEIVSPRRILLLTACQQTDPLELEVPQEHVPTVDELNEMLGGTDVQQVAMRTAVVYYQDEAGYLVPVSCSVPLEEGVARQVLNMMVDTEENSLSAQRLGLFTTIPEGTEVDIDVDADGLAKVSLSKEARNCPDALSESNMVSSIVQAVTEYPTVKTVQILINGEQVDTLPNGTPVGAPMSRQELNLESVDRSLGNDGAQQIMVYFESETAPAMVPVTRTVFSNADIETAVLEVLKGPREGSELSTQIPKGTGLVSVRRNGGVVTINLSNEFKSVMDNDDGGKAAVKALVLTCQQFPEVSEVKLQVEGKAFEIDVPTMAEAASINASDEVSMTSIFEDE
jgi:germination protein M